MTTKAFNSQGAGIEKRWPRLGLFMATPFFQRLLEQPLAGVKLPADKAVSHLADRRSRGVIAERAEIVCELSELFERVPRPDLQRCT